MATNPSEDLIQKFYKGDLRREKAKKAHKANDKPAKGADRSAQKILPNAGLKGGAK